MLTLTTRAVSRLIPLSTTLKPSKISIRLLATANTSPTTEPPQKKTPDTMYNTRTATVSTILSQKGEKFFSTKPDVTVYEAVKQMVARNIGSLVVVGAVEDEAAGIITERDYLEKIIVRGRSSKTTKVEEIMSEKELVAVKPSSTLADCMDLMVENRVRHIPVIDNTGKIKGLVSIGDVVKELVEMHRRNAEHMTSFISGAMY